MIQVSHCYTSFMCHVPNTCALHTIVDKLTMGNLQYALLNIRLQCLHNQNLIVNFV